ncbi:uncharacterized protein LOC128234734 isoform X2 [Mya arenaria]|uniref:uncharacterized protein LOC128234734 isoform X2 n=1 Tax=Mya arenaria TaxID=6604 RepID=UPI0022E1ACB2|nr:uncharacterized protein LOC128234734 isoform X2 [Mya arenaria]
MDFIMLIQWVALLAVCIYVRVISGSPYYVSEQKTNWGYSNCTLAIPNLNYTQSGIFAETEHETNLTMPEEGLWIGLFQAQLSFAYVGCNEMNSNGAVIVHNISECRWKSGCNTFAIRKADNKETKCTSICSITLTEGYKCGRQGHRYFSVYTVENDTICSDNCYKDAWKCLRCMPFIWMKCSYRQSRKIGIICSTNPFTDINGTVQAISETASNYSEAGEKCFAAGMFPATYGHINSSVITINTSYWTGIFRMNSLLRVNETFSTYKPKQHAYVTQDGTRLEVQFDDKGTLRRKSLCETPNFAGKATTATEGRSTSTSNILETTEDTRSKIQVDQRVPIAEISASVSAVVVLGILIVSFVILSKRGRLRCLSERKTTMTNKESPMQYIDTKYTEPETRDIPKAYPNQGYSMTEELPISTKNNTPGKPQMKDYSVDVNKVANTENNPHDIHHIAHIHNSLSQEPEEYDHLNHSGTSDDITSHLINDYDCTTAAIGENQDDTYNHLNERPQQNQITENLYGVQNENETSDIYNHLNERPKQRQSTENVYGVQNKSETDEVYNQLNERPERKNLMQNIFGLQDKKNIENEYDITV